MELYFAFSAMWMFSTHTDSYIYYYRTFSPFVPNIFQIPILYHGEISRSKILRDFSFVFS